MPIKAEAADERPTCVATHRLPTGKPVILESKIAAPPFPAPPTSVHSQSWLGTKMQSVYNLLFQEKLKPPNLFFFFFFKDVAFILLEGALCSFVEDFLTQNVDIYNINEVIIQTQTARKVAGTATYKSSKTEWNCVVLEGPFVHLVYSVKKMKRVSEDLLTSD